MLLNVANKTAGEGKSGQIIIVNKRNWEKVRKFQGIIEIYTRKIIMINNECLISGDK